MPFKLRNSKTIAAQMIAQVTAAAPSLTDYSEGAIARAMLESVADEIQLLDESVYSAVREAINTAVYKNFGFSRLPATYALGVARFTALQTLLVTGVIPIGTQLQVPGSPVIYVTTAAAIIAVPPAPNFVDVPVRALTPGAIGNTPANTITGIISSLNFNASVTNLIPLINGLDQESDAARFNRFQDFIAGLSRATPSALRAAAKACLITDGNGNVLERPQMVLISEPFQSGFGFLGLVNVYIDNGTGTASPTLVALVSDTLNGYVDGGGTEHLGYRAAGVTLNVLAVIPAPLNVFMRVILRAGADPTATIVKAQNAVIAYLQTLQVDDPAVFAQIEGAAVNAGGIADLVIDAPLKNVVPFFGYRVTPGIITVTPVPSL